MPFVHGLIEFHTLVRKLLYVCTLGHLMYFLSVQCAPYTCTVHIVVRSPRLQDMRSAATSALQSGTSNYFIYSISKQKGV